MRRPTRSISIHAARWNLLAAVFLLCGPTAIDPAAAQTAVQTARPQPEGSTGRAANTVSRAEDLMVAAAHPLAVDAGVALLERGGSAVDAAIAAQLVLNLVEPQSSGIGGGLFLLHWDATDKTLTSIDGRETAPAAAGPDYWLRDGEPMKFSSAVVGGRSAGVPGTLAALELAHGKHGRLPWAVLFEPAITLAEEGFMVTPRLNALVGQAAGRGLAAFPVTAA